MEDRWTEGEMVSLLAAREPVRVLRLARGPQRIGVESVLDLTDQIGQPVGGAFPWLGTTYRVVRPSLADLLATLRRGAQIVTAKDAAQILFLAGVAPGGRVAEAGSGSGALTLVLASAVGSAGQVISYDRRPEFIENARANVTRAGWGDRVEFRVRDVAQDGWGESGFSSVVLDLAEPWEVLEATHSALAPGGYVATYTPTYNQLERTVRKLREVGFSEVRASELIERGLHVGEGGTRPEFDMLGHTGFLAAGRKVT
jgi:tRNA (adenine57-N1/adenine58-N1)-methyltransferase catalytic subunit